MEQSMVTEMNTNIITLHTNIFKQKWTYLYTPLIFRGMKKFKLKNSDFFGIFLNLCMVFILVHVL